MFWRASLIVARLLALVLLMACPRWTVAGRAQATAVGDAPPLPPFAGDLVNAQRIGDLVVYCTSTGAAPLGSVVPRRTRIWLLNREVLEEARSPESLCDPAISPRVDRFVAVSPTAVWVFAIPLDQGTIVRGFASDSRLGRVSPEPAVASYARPQWSLDGRFIAVMTGSDESTRVEVLSAETGVVVATSAAGATTVKWSTDASSVVLGGTVVPLP